MKKIIMFAVAAAFVATPAVAAPGDTAEAEGAATAEVVAPLTIVHVAAASLNFGKFTTGTTGGTVVVTQAGVGSSTTDVTLLSDSVESADGFEVEGEADRTFTISTTDGSVGNGTDTMDFITDAPADGTLDSAGEASISVGGTLTVVGGESAGVYDGTYDVTVTYN